MTASASRKPFGVMPDGTAVDLITLSNGRGIELRAMTLGGVITHLLVPDRTGTPGDVVLGYDALEGYLRKSPHFGCITGRCANRIANASFAIGGTEVHLVPNAGTTPVARRPARFRTR